MKLATLIDMHFDDVKQSTTKVSVESRCDEGNVKMYKVGNVIRIDVKPVKEG